MSYVGLGATAAATPAASPLAESIALQADPTKGRKYRFYKGAVQYAAQQADRALTAFQKTQAGKAIYAAGGVADTVEAIYKQVQSREFRADASGVVAVAGATDRFVRATTSFLSNLNVNSQVLKEVNDWTGVGASCAAGIAAGTAAGGYGAAFGIAACGLIALGKLFDYIDVGPEYVDPWSTPRTIFCPDSASVKYIMVDAMRLSQVLRAYYGVTNFAQLLPRLEGPDTFQWISSMRYPSRPKVNAAGQLVAQGDKPLPGHNLRTALQLFSFGRSAAAAHSNTRDGLATLAGWRTGGLEPSGRGLYHRFEDDHDVSQTVIANGAYFGRCAAATQNHTRVRATVMDCGDIEGWPYKTNPGTVRTVDFAPFVVVDELLNFFAAVTARELDDARRVSLDGRRGDRAIIEDYGFGNLNPTRHLYVRDADRSGQPPSEGGPSDQRYGVICWTNLGRATGSRCDNLDDALYNCQQPRDEYLREAAAIRLMAALSFLHQQYAWSSTISAARVDPVSLIEPLGTRDAYGPIDANAQMREPLDPRQIVNGRLTSEEAKPVQRVARPLERASVRLQTVTGSGLYSAPAYVVPFAKAKTDIVYLVQQVIVRDAWLRDAAQKAVAAAVAAGKTIIVSPTLTTLHPSVTVTEEGFTLSPAGWLQLTHAAEVAKKPAVTPLLLAAGALLALKFFR